MEKEQFSEFLFPAFGSWNNITPSKLLKLIRRGGFTLNVCSNKAF